MPNMRESSRWQWTSGDTVAEINAGSLQRIADASELMAKNHAELIAERDKFKSWYEDYRAGYEAMIRSNRAYKAWVTRLKRIAYPPQFSDESVGFEGRENDRGKN